MVIAPPGHPNAEGKLEDEEIQKANPGLASACRARDDEPTAIFDRTAVRGVLAPVGRDRTAPTVVVAFKRFVLRRPREQRALPIGATVDRP